VAGVGLMFYYRGTWKGVLFLGGGLLAGLMGRMMHLFLLRKARIVSIGTNTLEMRFSSESYARGFCQLNELYCSKERLQKKRRETKVMAGGKGMGKALKT
jgi:hypothetical protein